MRTNAAASSIQRAIAATAKPTATTTTDGIGESAQDGTTTAPDFARMTRQEMRDWVNEQIHTGQMSLDDSTPFVSMTFSLGADGAEADLDTPVDFLSATQGGIAGAYARGDRSAASYLEAALAIMRRDSTDASTGVDFTA